MILERECPELFDYSFPRTRGDDPEEALEAALLSCFSPHPRG